jgi:hypothetical protein
LQEKSNEYLCDQDKIREFINSHDKQTQKEMYAVIFMMIQQLADNIDTVEARVEAQESVSRNLKKFIEP